jgi:hypothetical protein
VGGSFAVACYGVANAATMGTTFVAAAYACSYAGMAISAGVSMYVRDDVEV